MDSKIVGSIEKGVCILLGIGTDDTDKDVDYMVNKILNVRVFEEGGAMWKKGVKDAGLELLCGKKVFIMRAFLTLQANDHAQYPNSHSKASPLKEINLTSIKP